MVVGCLRKQWQNAHRGRRTTFIPTRRPVANTVVPGPQRFGGPERVNNFETLW